MTHALEPRQTGVELMAWRLKTSMDISDWRKKIDELDRKLVELLSQRAQAAHEIGKLKRDAGMPIYEPDRERAVFDNVRGINPGPLPDRDLLCIYERIMDIMRQIQQEEIAPKTAVTDAARDTELDSEVND
jgi:chorismate mutase-like protein